MFIHKNAAFVMSLGNYIQFHLVVQDFFVDNNIWNVVL